MKVKTCKHATEEYPATQLNQAGYSCQWTVGRKDLPPHLTDGGYWIEQKDCERCPCWAAKRGSPKCNEVKP